MSEPIAAVEPLRNFYFSLKVGSEEIAAFAGAENLTCRVNPIKYREGGRRKTTRWLIGETEYGEVTLRFGVTRSRELWTWITNVSKGEPDRRNVSIIMYEADNVTEALRYNLSDAFPVQWTCATLDARGNDVAFEELHLVCEGIELNTAAGASASA